MLGDKPKKLVFIGSDHAGFKMKNDLREALAKGDFEITDLGTFTEDSCDYPDIAREVGEKVREHKDSFGILLCGTGIGMSMAANKLRGIRAALVTSEEMVEMSRKHNNANVLCMGARISTPELIQKMADKFLATTFDAEERHARRVQKIDEL